MLSLLLAALSCLVYAAPIAHSGSPLICPIEDLPWTISNIVVYTSNIGSTTAAKESNGMDVEMANDTIFFHESFIDFHFCDSNEGLELKVECSRFTNGSLLGDEAFYPCDQRGVVFRFDGNSLEVRRDFKSRCLGKPPYDGAIAFGRADMNLTATASPNGTLATQTRMEMPISSLS